MKNHISLTNDINWQIRIRVVFTITLLAFLISAADFFFDYISWTTPLHYIFEGLPLVSLTLLLTYLLRLLHQARKDATHLATRANDAEKNATKWKQELKEILKGLSDAIDQQFKIWKLTKAEKEIGILILKGMSFKEIADIRSTSERTVRQQTLDIYKKSNIAGRAQFSAFFLEDLLLPLEIQPKN